MDFPLAATLRPRSKAEDAPTILLVEDDEATRHSIVALLKGRGYRVESFDACEDLLAQSRGVGRSCLLLDYHFDGMSGFQLLDTLRERDSVMSTILYSGRFDSAIARRAAGYGEIVAFLHKPWNGEELFAAIDKACESS